MTLSAPHNLRLDGDHVETNGRGRRALTLVIALALTSCAASPPDDGDGEAATSDLSTRVIEHLEQVDEFDKVRAVLVYEGDRPVLELYRGDDADSQLDLRSVTKSVVGTLIGIAVDDGLIGGVDATLGELLPDHRAVMDDEVAAIPLERILTHTAGFAEGGPGGTVGDLDFGVAPDWTAAILADRVERGPGDGSFGYSDAGSHLLAAILHEATDARVLDFAREKLFDPLGIETEPAWIETGGTTDEERAAAAEAYAAAGFAWPIDPQGVHTGWGYMKLRPQDLVALGRLYVNGGRWNGEQLVSPEWIDAATAAHVDTFATPNGYGYQWWTHAEEGQEMFLALGFAGNLIAVIPDRDLVVVVAATFEGLDPLENAQKFTEGEALTLLQYVILRDDR